MRTKNTIKNYVETNLSTIRDRLAYISIALNIPTYQLIKNFTILENVFLKYFLIFCVILNILCISALIILLWKFSKEITFKKKFLITFIIILLCLVILVASIYKI